MPALRYKVQASAVHFVASLLIAAAVLWLTFLLWYPQPLATLQGADRIIGLIIFVDITLGPIFTFIIYSRRKTKRELWGDFSVIVGLQCAALAFGIWTLFDTRPLYLVFAKDRIEVVSADELIATNEEKPLSEHPSRQKPLKRTGPVLVALDTTLAAAKALHITLDAFNGGPDLAQYPDFYVPLATQREQVRNKLIPLSKHPQASHIRHVLLSLRDSAAPPETLLFLPVTARWHDGIAIFTADATFLTILAIPPVWGDS